MVNYKCIKCGKLYNNKNDYNRHLKRKTPCVKPQAKQTTVECPKCSKSLSSKSVLNRHLSYYCKRRNDAQKNPQFPHNHTGSQDMYNTYNDRCEKPGNFDNSEYSDDNNAISPPNLTVPHYSVEGQNVKQSLYDYREELYRFGPLEHSNEKHMCSPHNFSNSAHELRKNNVCDYCHKTFARNDSLTRHLDNSCKIKKKIELEQMDKRELLQTIKQLEKQLKQQSSTQINNTTTNNTTNNNNTMTNSNNTHTHTHNINNGTVNNINIEIRPYGKEDLSHITDEIYKKILDKGPRCCSEFIKKIHFDANKPENHNIYISNMDSRDVHTYDGSDWEVRDTVYTIDDMFEDKKTILANKKYEFEELIELGNDDRILSRCVNRFNRFYEDENPTTIKNLQREIKRVLYNGRNMTKKTRDQVEMQRILNE